MIRLMGLVNFGKSFTNEGLTDKQKEEMDMDDDGDIDAEDLEQLRKRNRFKNEGHDEDHEVSMGQSTLDSIIRHATELKGKLGVSEKNIPAWIQDHITNAENYIDQANTSYHEYTDEKPQQITFK